MAIRLFMGHETLLVVWSFLNHQYSNTISFFITHQMFLSYLHFSLKLFHLIFSISALSWSCQLFVNYLPLLEYYLLSHFLQVHLISFLIVLPKNFRFLFLIVSALFRIRGVFRLFLHSFVIFFLPVSVILFRFVFYINMADYRVANED